MNSVRASLVWCVCVGERRYGLEDWLAKEDADDTHTKSKDIQDLPDDLGYQGEYEGGEGWEGGEEEPLSQPDVADSQMSQQSHDAQVSTSHELIELDKVFHY